MPPTIFQFIKSEENRFLTEEIKVGDNWNWNFRNHVQMIFHLKNGMFFTGSNNWLRAFKNIMQPILNLSYWMEDIEMKDVVFFIENKMGRVLSFLVKKYHDEVYVRENDLDTFIDEVTESDVDYGGVLVQPTDSKRPEVLQLNAVAFCDQTDILGGVTAFKYNFSPAKLRSMAKIGWGDEKNGANISIEDLIVLATFDKQAIGTMGTHTNQSTGKNIEVYILKGSMPENYLKDNNNMELFYEQIQIVAFYTDKDGNKEGVILYRKKQQDSKLYFHTSKKVYGRALGQGMGEVMLQPQIWTNFLEIHKMAMIEAGSKILLYTDDDELKDKNKIQDMDNLELAKVGDNKRIFKIPNESPNNIQMISNEINSWYQHAQLGGSAFDPVLGKEQSSGTTFRGQERVVQQGKGLHDRRRGQRAKFFELLYRDLIIPDMKKEIVKGKKFLATLSPEEMTWVVEQLANNFASREEVNMVLDGKLPPDGMTFEDLKEQNKQKFIKDFSKKGGKHLLEIIENELKDVEIKIGINIAGKQKDLMGFSDKILSIIQFAFQDPERFKQTLQIPGMASSFNDILEYSGISPIDFSEIINTPLPTPQEATPVQPTPQLTTV